MKFISIDCAKKAQYESVVFVNVSGDRSWNWEFSDHYSYAYYKVEKQDVYVTQGKYKDETPTHKWEDGEFVEIKKEKEVKHKFNIGDKVKVVQCGRGFALSCVGKIYTIKTVGGTYEKQAGYQVVDENGKLHLNRCYDDFVGEDSFDLVSACPKSLLKDFVRAKTHDGVMHIVCGDMLVDADQCYVEFKYLDDNNLTNRDAPHFDVVEIYDAPEFQNHWLSHEYYGELLWKAESQEDKEKREAKEALQSSVVKMEQELKAMKEQLESFK